MCAAASIMTMRYAAKIAADPTKNLVCGDDFSSMSMCEEDAEDRLHHLYNGKAGLPTEIIKRIAEVQDTSTDYLPGLADTPAKPIRLSKAEKLMIKTLRSLYRDQQEAVHNQVRFFQNQRE